VGQRVLAAVRDVEGLKDPELSIKEGYPEVIVRLDRDLLAAKGIAPEQVAQRLRTAVQGDVATRFDREGEKIDIRVRADRSRLASLQDLRSMSIQEGAPPLPLSAVASIEVVEARARSGASTSARSPS
jgi:multidrug efflux pump subunit AcrB